MRRVLVGIALLLLAGAAVAQSKLPVFVNASISSDDPDGSSLTFELKEAIRGSHGYRLIEDSAKYPYIKISLSTVPLRQAGRTTGTIYSYVIAYDRADLPLGGYLIRSGVQSCPSPELKVCARDTLANVELAATTVRDREPSLMRTLENKTH